MITTVLAELVQDPAFVLPTGALITTVDFG